MIVEIIIGLLVLSLILNVFLFIAVKRSLQKIEAFEDKILTTDIYIKRMLDNMRDIDERGMFEKDDAVGSVFEQLHILIKFYSKLIKTENGENEKREEVLYRGHGQGNS